MRGKPDPGEEWDSPQATSGREGVAEGTESGWPVGAVGESHSSPGERLLPYALFATGTTSFSAV